MNIDLNCDMGESFGLYAFGQDEALMPLITSANIACGFHAGDPQVMAKTVRLAAKAGVAVGAHPGYPDLNGFGRRDMSLSGKEIEVILLYQIGALVAFCRAEHVELSYVKPHGALYNRAAVDRVCAHAIVKAVMSFSKSLILVGLAGSTLIEAGQDAGLRTANEGFPDRTYLPDGCLMPRGQPGAVLVSPQAVAEHAVQLAMEGIRIEKESGVHYLPVDTLCLHGDNPSAVANAQHVTHKLKEAGVVLAPLATK